MTNEEKAIIMAYTGVCTLTGDNLKHYYEYVNKLFGRPLQTFEFLLLSDKIKQLAEPDFCRICRDE